jgi:hypothetical protein
LSVRCPLRNADSGAGGWLPSRPVASARQRARCTTALTALTVCIQPTGAMFRQGELANLRRISGSRPRHQLVKQARRARASRGQRTGNSDASDRAQQNLFLSRASARSMLALRLSSCAPRSRTVRRSIAPTLLAIISARKWLRYTAALLRAAGRALTTSSQ